MSGLVPTLARYALAEQTASMPEQVLHHARRALIDRFAALIGGCREPPARILVAAIGDATGPPSTAPASPFRPARPL